MINKFESRSIAIPTELIKALSIAGEDTVVVRFEDNRTVYCYLDDGEVIIAEDIIEADEDECADEEGDDCDAKCETTDVCSDCPHYCPVCGECTRED